MSDNILVINIHSSRNAGDAALLHATLEQIKNNFPSGRITLCMDDPQSHSGMEPVVRSIFSWVFPFHHDGKTGWNYLHLVLLLPATLIPVLGYRFFKRKIWFLSPKSIHGIVDAYLEADLVISKPGGFLYSSGRGISLLVAIYSITYAYLALKPIYIFPQSIGPFKYWWEKRLIKWLLEKVRILMVREPISYQVIKDIGVKNQQVHLIPDLAFTIQDAGREAGANWLNRHGLDSKNNVPLLGITVINWGAQNKDFTLQSEYEEACSKAIRYFVENVKGYVLLFPHVWGPLPSQDDRIPAHRILETLSDISAQVKVVDEPITAELLKSIYGWMEVFIGTRMHSNIFALSQGVPVIAIGYLHKTAGIARMVGIEQWVMAIQQTRGNALRDKLAELWPERQLWREKIRLCIPDLIREADRAGKIVAEDYFGDWKLNKRGS
jgi:colanic acid/amylovoran biosynthesis protein